MCSSDLEKATLDEGDVGASGHGRLLPRRAATTQRPLARGLRRIVTGSAACAVAGQRAAGYVNPELTMRLLAAIALIASAAPSLAATPTTGASHGRLEVGVTITGGGRIASTATGSAAPRLAPRITRESADGVAYTLIYY